MITKKLAINWIELDWFESMQFEIELNWKK